MRIIAVVNQKGGCGKTTVSINLASALAEIGQKTLLIDMDPQAHCAVGLAVPEEQIEQSIYDVLISNSRNEPIKLSEILWQISDNLELAPASIDLSAFEQQMSGITERENCLKKVLVGMDDEFDYVIIDCPPAVSLLTFNALRAATDVIVPVETGYFALHGLSRQLETLKILCERCNQQIEVKVLASMYDIRTKMAREILSELRSHFGDKMFKTTVNFNTKIKEASSFGQPINEYDPASKGQLDFKALAEEVVDLQGKQQRHDLVNSLAGQLEKISSSADELLEAAKQPAKAAQAPKIEESVNIELAPIDIQPAKQPLTIEKINEPATAPQPLAIEKIDEPTTAPQPLAIEKIDEPTTAKQPLTIEKINEPTTAKQPLAIEKIDEPTTAPQPQPAKIDEKLSDYYGVTQVNDAIAFVTLYPRAKSVHIAGDFNNWQPVKTPLEKVGQSGVWQTEMKLPAGKYRYRLVVDGQWQQDPYNEHTEVNPFGGFNSVIEVK